MLIDDDSAVLLAAAARSAQVTGRMCQVCHAWRSAIQAAQDTIWKPLCFTRFPRLVDIIKLAQEPSSYRDLYAQELRNERGVSCMRAHPNLKEYIFTFELMYEGQVAARYSGHRHQAFGKLYATLEDTVGAPDLHHILAIEDDDSMDDSTIEDSIGELEKMSVSVMITRKSDLNTFCFYRGAYEDVVPESGWPAPALFEMRPLPKVGDLLLDFARLGKFDWFEQHDWPHVRAELDFDGELCVSLEVFPGSDEFTGALSEFDYARWLAFHAPWWSKQATTTR